MARRPIAAVAAIVLILEAFGIAFVNWILGKVADNQSMSLAGIDPDAIAVGSWIAGGVFGLYLVLCAVIMLRCATWDRAPGSFARIVLISCAVIHGVLGAVTVGLVGWPAFAFMMVVLALIVLTLVAYDRKENGAEIKDAPAKNGNGAVAEA